MDRLEQMIAIEEIKQLKARYFRYMDTRDFGSMAQVFCRDAKFDCSEGMLCTPVGGTAFGTGGPVKHGRDAIMEWIEASFQNQTSVHHGHSHEIWIESETEASGVIAMEDYIRAMDRQTRRLHGAGHYHERYRYEDGAWRIMETKLTRLFLDIEDEFFPA